MHIIKKNKYLIALFLLTVVILFQLLWIQNTEKKPVKDMAIWENQIANKGGKKAYDQFKNAYSTKSFSVAHLASHIFGASLYKIEGASGITTCDDSFSFGCYHGFFSQAIAINGLQVVKKLSQTCDDKFGLKYSSPCKHGIGHGLVEFLGHDKDHLIQALESCKTKDLKDKQEQHFGCYSGVFMEYNFPIYIGANNAEMGIREMGENEPYETCETIPERYKSSCYFSIGQWWEKVYSYDYDKLGEFCNKIPNITYADTCFKGIGNVVGPSSNYNPEEIIKRCAKMPTSEGVSWCVSTAAWTVLEQTKNKNDAIATCKNLNSDQKKLCPIQ